MADMIEEEEELKYFVSMEKDVLVGDFEASCSEKGG